MADQNLKCKYIFDDNYNPLYANGNFYLPLNAKGKTQSGTKDSMVVVFDGRY